MKTAMQELIDRLDKTEKQLDRENNLVMSSALFAAKNMALELLEKEKEQIINARDSTASELMKNMEDVWILGKSEYKTRTPEEYYNQTYNQNK
jgi:hypothetical protein